MNLDINAEPMSQQDISLKKASLTANIIAMEANRKRIIRTLMIVFVVTLIAAIVFFMTVPSGAVAVALRVAACGAVVAVTIASVAYVFRFDDAIKNEKLQLDDLE